MRDEHAAVDLLDGLVGDETIANADPGPPAQGLEAEFVGGGARIAQKQPDRRALGLPPVTL